MEFARLSPLFISPAADVFLATLDFLSLTYDSLRSSKKFRSNGYVRATVFQGRTPDSAVYYDTNTLNRNISIAYWVSFTLYQNILRGMLLVQ